MFDTSPKDVAKRFAGRILTLGLLYMYLHQMKDGTGKGNFELACMTMSLRLSFDKLFTELKAELATH